MAPPEDAPPTDDPQQTKRAGFKTRQLTLLYVFALSCVALLSIGAQALVQWQLRSGESGSRVINLAGRQRMLSQRLAKAALRLQHAPAEKLPASREELAATLELWSQSHHGLQHGDPELGLPGRNSEAITELFDVIRPHYEAMQKAAQRLAAATGPPANENQDVATIQEYERSFLIGMDAIVSQYVVEAETRVARLSRLEFALLALTLLVLLAEGALIFRPAVRRIAETVQRLELLSERLRHAKDEAELGNAAKTRFLANVSHELRTPMTAVLGMTELARETDDQNEREHYLGIVAEAGGSLLGLLNDLIDVARIDAGRLELDAEPFAPQEVVERVARMLEVATNEKGLELNALSPPLPLPRVRGDARRLEQILINLVGNAIKWTDEGSVSLGCEAVSLGSEHATLRFWVDDTGAGISKADQQRVFEPFTQLSEAGRGPRRGAGLGLSICRRIADAMQADLELTSTPGVGTRVTLTGRFPVAVSAELPATEQLVERADPPARFATLVRMLLVEDTEVNQLLLDRILRSENCRVEIAGSGEEAVDLYSAERFDLVLLDFELPGMDGAATAAALRRLDAQRGAAAPPMVCITAHASATGSIAEPPFDAVVTKPIARESLLQTLADLLAKQGQDHPISTPDSGAAGVSPALREELVDAFLTVVGPQSEQLRCAVAGGRLGEARLVAHRFLGQIGYFDLPLLEDKLSRLESACDAGDRAAADQLANEVLTTLAEESARLRTASSAVPCNREGARLA